MLTTLPSVSSLKLSSSPCLGPPATSFVTTQYSGLWRYEGILRDITRYVSTCRAACPHPRAGRTRPRWRGRTRSRRTPGSRYTCSQSPQPAPRMLRLNKKRNARNKLYSITLQTSQNSQLGPRNVVFKISLHLRQLSLML